MALTAIQAQRLHALGLDKFLAENKSHYKAMAKEAYEYTETTLKPTKQPVRQDDVIGHLQAGIELDDALTTFLDTKHKTQQFWTKFFTNLIVDTFWKELQNGQREKRDEQGKR